MSGSPAAGAARTLNNWPMPGRIVQLPRDRHGYPIPWFVATLDDGSRDFRIADGERHIDAVRFGLCWICGGALGRHKAFALGPMCAVNRVSAEPPSHTNCSIFAARVCPFLATPQMTRREAGKPDGVQDPGGIMLRRNPGVTLVWVTSRYTTRWADHGQGGYLHHIGDPTALHWFCQGRPATRAEILESMETGLPSLQEACQLDPKPELSLKALDADYRQALTLVPA